jgi:hypothetical protein
LQPFVGQMLAAGYKSLGDPLLSVGDPVLFPFWMAETTGPRPPGRDQEVDRLLEQWR